MSTYLFLNLAIIIFPVLLSFDKKVSFYKYFSSVVISIVIVGAAYIIWDAIAVMRGDWNFNPEYISGFTYFNLPLDEILFFISVPYACIFIYEVLLKYIGDKVVVLNRTLVFISIFVLFFLAISFYQQYYTFTVLLFCAAFLIFSISFFNSILKSKVYWMTILITYIPFLIINYILTSLPVVSYNSKAIWGIRIITIPLEDFFYSFSMISFWLLVYLISKKYFFRNYSLDKE
jgi:lycopene cyclase domain-containing protein